MSKKVNYFSHDFSARNDTKLITLRRKCWMAGLGIFWCLIEMLYESWWWLDCDDETLENLAYEWRCEVEILKIVIFECNLFVVENEKFYSKSVNERLKKIDESRERKSEAWKKWMQKRWANNNNVITDVIENDNNVMKNYNDVIKNDNIVITEPQKPITENNKKINKKINKNTLNPLTWSVVGVREEFPKSQNAEKDERKGKKRVLFQKFFEKFPKKTHEQRAEIAFLSLLESEIKEISKVLPFWLEAWKNTPTNLLPNAYDWLFNKRWREALPTSTQSHPMAVQTEKIEEEKRLAKQKTEEQERIKTDAQTKQKTEERAKILAYFATLSSERQKEITSQIFVPKTVRNGEILLQNGIILALRDEFLTKTL